VLLLDDIEKAHPDLFNILLQVLDHGKLTDHNGKSVNFRNVVLIMTTNAGASDMARPPMGFNRAKREGEDAEAVTKLFTPEFRNRLDAIVPFSGLSPEIIAQVVEKYIFQLEAQLADRSVSIELSDEAIQWIAEKGYDDKFGARPLARVIQEHIKKPLAEELLFGKLENGGTVKVIVTGKGPDRVLAFEFYPLDPSKKAKSPEDEETDDDGPMPVLADATPKKALPGPKDKGDKPKESGAVPSVPRKKKDE
jgi:ATP-dependent Clp protease ATP-binding subunit ClpA